MTDAPQKAPTEEQVQQTVAVLRQWVWGTVIVHENEQWKLELWALQNPAIAAAAKAAREKE